MKRKAFTMVELVFVIVVLGILASIAATKMSVTRDDALIAKARSQVASIRSGIALEKGKKMMEGSATIYPTDLGDTSSTLFGGVLDYPVYSEDKNGKWKAGTTANTYYFNWSSHPGGILFTYNNSTGTFDCSHTIDICQDLTE